MQQLALAAEGVGANTAAGIGDSGLRKQCVAGICVNAERASVSMRQRAPAAVRRRLRRQCGIGFGSSAASIGFGGNAAAGIGIAFGGNAAAKSVSMRQRASVSMREQALAGIREQVSAAVCNNSFRSRELRK